MMKEQVKTFLSALEYCKEDVRKAKKYLDDKRLSHIEKQILECFFHLRDNQHQIVIDKLIKATAANHIVEFYRLFYIGLAYNNLCDFSQAVDFIESALRILPVSEYPAQESVAYNNLFLIHSNTKNVKKMATIVDKLEKIKNKTEAQKISFDLVKLRFFSQTGNDEKCKPLLVQLNKFMKKMNEGQSTVFLLHKFDFYIKQEKLEKCLEVMEEMTKFRKFQCSSNYNFIKNILLNLTEDKPYYLIDSDYSDFPIVFHQIKCLQKLEQKNSAEAHFHWNELKKLSSETYQEDFKYSGDVCLFSLGLKKQLENLPQKQEFEIAGNTKEEIFLNILTQASSPVPSDIMYRHVYGSEAESKDDLRKLHKLVSRARQKFNSDISFKQGCYALVKKKSA